eukprot:6459331-Amphidinium_carterae.1
MRSSENIAHPPTQTTAAWVDKRHHTFKAESKDTSQEISLVGTKLIMRQRHVALRVRGQQEKAEARHSVGNHAEAKAHKGLQEQRAASKLQAIRLYIVQHQNKSLQCIATCCSRLGGRFGSLCV